MTTPLVIFGTGDIAELAHFYFSRDTAYRPVAFTVDRDFIAADVFHDLPVVPFDEVAARYPPGENAIFVALSYSRLNALRKEKYLAAKALGYRLASYVSPRASVFNDGDCGDNCFILEDNTIQPFVRIGSNVTLWSGNHIGHHSVVGSHCFMASHVVVSGGVRIGESCFVGVNATLRDHITVGERCIIGAGALLLADAEADGVYMAEPTTRARVPSSRLRGI
jgi:sugar O-acyltransferase (sialic acid O-acetyltransferase NeuD family)